MTGGAAALLGVRLLAVWIVVSALSGLAAIGGIDARIVGYSGAVGVSIGAAATQIGAAVLAWKYAPWLAARICGTQAEPATSPELSSSSAAQAAVGVVGVFMLTEALPQALWMIAALIATKVMGPSPLAGQPAYENQMGLYTVGGIANASAVLARVSIGTLLIVRASRVATLILEADRKAE
jgi:hypothetical protein